MKTSAGSSSQSAASGHILREPPLDIPWGKVAAGHKVALAAALDGASHLGGALPDHLRVVTRCGAEPALVLGLFSHPQAHGGSAIEAAADGQVFTVRAAAVLKGARVGHPLGKADQLGGPLERLGAAKSGYRMLSGFAAQVLRAVTVVHNTIQQRRRFVVV